MNIPRRFQALAFISILVVGDAAHAERASARAIEARLYAPCCYSQTLDEHESEIAQSLRAEIERRVALGETADAIDADFIARYGPQIHAIPSWGPAAIPGVALGGILVSALLIGVTMRRWLTVPPGTRPSIASKQGPMGAPAHDELDARLDHELDTLDR